MPQGIDPFQAARTLFEALCDLPAAEREARLATDCAGDPELRRRVEALLAHDREPHPGLDRSPAATWTRLAPEEPPPLPARIGSFEIVALLGVGGMGVVYEALQPELGRRVALKVVRTTLLGGDLRRRALQEAALLARLRHPGLATVYEVGQAVVDGVPHPFLAMELVAGRPLDAHARELRLDLRARLALLVRVARAVHHAHEQGVLHRDLKPANVLVDAAGEPRVLDFGVARLLEHEGTTLTAPGAVVGTLGFMSPEQVSGARDGLDARSDVYALGAMLYQLVAGRLPHELADLPLPEAARRVCERTPRALGELGLAGCAPGSDLETIASTALATEREHRYASAAALADDLERFLAHEPIAARPASTLYQLRLFARRNRGLIAASSLAAVALLVSALASGWMALRQRDLRRQAEEHGREAERLAYRANVLAAAMALEDDNPSQARTLLERLQPGPEHWELARLRRGLEEWLARFTPDIGRVWQAGFTDGSSTLLALSSQGALGRWDAASGAPLGRLGPDPARAYPVCLSPDGTLALSVNASVARLWSTDDGSPRGEFHAPSALLVDARNTAVFARDGTRVALTAADRRLLVLDLASGVFHGPFEGGVPALDEHGERLVAVGEGHTHVWEVATGARLESFPWPARAPRSVALDRTGECLVVADSTRELHRLALGPGPDHGQGHRLGTELPDVVTSIVFDPSNRFLATMFDDGSVWLWDLAEERLRHRFQVGRSSWKTSLAWSPDGARILSAAHARDEIYLWDGREALEPEVLRGHTSYVYPVAYALGGERIVSGSWDGTLILWSARSGREFATLHPQDERVLALAVSPDGARIASASPDRPLVLLDAATGATLARTADAEGWNAASWSPSNRLAAGTAPAPGKVVLFDGDDLATLATLPVPEAAVGALAFAPREPRMAVAAGRRLLLVETPGLTEVASIEGQAVIGALAFSPDGRTLATGDAAGRIVLLDAATLAERRVLTGHRQEVFGLAYTPDGSRVVSGGRDALLRLWDPGSGDLLAEFAGHESYIWSVCVSPDGTRLLTGSGDGTVRQWESEPSHVTWERRRAAEAEEGAPRAR